MILLNIISIKKEITQHNLDWGASLALFKEIQALSWQNFVTDADFLWLVSPNIQQPNKCCTKAPQNYRLNGPHKITTQFILPPLFTSPLRTYLAQYLRQYILTH